VAGLGLRDSLSGEQVRWRGQPKTLRTPRDARLAALAFGLLACVTLTFAITVGLSLQVRATGMLVFASWCGTLSILCWRLPLVFRSELVFLLTDHKVLWKRGRLRRSVERTQVSFARIVWHPTMPEVGDLVLVRAIPTGALRRTLTLTLPDVHQPDRLWAEIRGRTASDSMGNGNRPVPQRLEDGERVLWSGRPLASTWSARRAAQTALSFGLFGLGCQTAVRVVSPLMRVKPALSEGLFAGLVIGVALSVLFVVGAAVLLAHATLIRPRRLTRDTRYYVTNRRVLIRRGAEELSLERSRVASVITVRSFRFFGALAVGPMVDLFIVIDGPRSRGMAVGGAFGRDDGDALSPVFAAIGDANLAHEALTRRDLQE
jgi:hypothetical protein